jgi:hypothetical protein
MDGLVDRQRGEALTTYIQVTTAETEADAQTIANQESHPFIAVFHVKHWCAVLRDAVSESIVGRRT